MDIDKLTLGEVKQLTHLFNPDEVTSYSPSHSFVTGKLYLIQTVTHYFSGILVSVTDSDIVLDKAAWIADTGRFADAMVASEKLLEIEPLPGAYIVSRGAIIGFCEPTWESAPTEQRGG
jgi:hypothetical protein